MPFSKAEIEQKLSVFCTTVQLVFAKSGFHVFSEVELSDCVNLKSD